MLGRIFKAFAFSAVLMLTAFTAQSNAPVHVTANVTAGNNSVQVNSDGLPTPPTVPIPAIPNPTVPTIFPTTTTTTTPPTPPPNKQKLPPNQDPSQSAAPSNDYMSNCFSSNYSQAACDRSALANINYQLAQEGYGPLPLPNNYESLSLTQQLIVSANAERTIRGLSYMPESSNLDAMAAQGARNGTDPNGPNGYRWGSNIAWDYPTVLSADYVWMYDDGTNSPNSGCKSAGDSGCWGHRNNILLAGNGKSGAGYYNNNGTLNLTQLFVINYPN